MSAFCHICPVRLFHHRLLAARAPAQTNSDTLLSNSSLPEDSDSHIAFFGESLPDASALAEAIRRSGLDPPGFGELAKTRLSAMTAISITGRATLSSSTRTFPFAFALCFLCRAAERSWGCRKYWISGSDAVAVGSFSLRRLRAAANLCSRFLGIVLGRFGFALFLSFFFFFSFRFFLCCLKRWISGSNSNLDHGSHTHMLNAPASPHEICDFLTHGSQVEEL